MYLLEAFLPRLSALEEMRLRQSREKMTPEHLFDLTYLSTGDADYADKEAADLLMAEIREGRYAGWMQSPKQ